MTTENGPEVAKKMPKLILNDGVEMPLLGFGTSKIQGSGERGDKAFEAILHAIKCGYRFIDTAFLYGNEETVGKAIKAAIEDRLIADRKELFICTKVWCTSHKRESVVKACRSSLERLQLDYIDLYLVHWPVAYVEGLDPINPKDAETGKLLYSDTSIVETWRGMEDCKDLGLARSIGLSNFNHKQCDEILAVCKHKPTVNQVELHPYLSQVKLHQYSEAKGIILNAYCPLGAPGATWAPRDAPVLIQDPVIAKLSQKYSKSPAQIILRYHLQRKISPIPKSVTPQRIHENISILDFQLTDGEMETLLGLDRKLRYCTNTAGEHVDDHPLYPFHEEY